MINWTTITGSGVVATVLLGSIAGCTRPDVSCSSAEVKKLVSQLLREANKNDFWSNVAIDAERSTFGIVDIRTRSSDGRRATCAATLDFDTVVFTPTGQTMRGGLSAVMRSVNYKVELTDDRSKIYVEVSP